MPETDENAEDRIGKRTETLLKLADASWRNMDARRSYEWKANFGLWTALGLIAGFLFQSKVGLLSSHPKLAVLLATLVLFGMGYTFCAVRISGLYRGNKVDMRRACHYWRLVESTLGLEPQYQVYPETGYLKNWSAQSQILITLILLFVAFLAVLVNVSSRPEQQATALNPPVQKSSK
jgi:hypothetical protein